MSYMGIESYSSFRKPAWQELGDNSVTITEPTNVRDMFEQAHLLNWNMELVPTPSIGRCHFEEFDVVRTNPFDGLPDTLGRVRTRYNIFSNEDMLSFIETLTHGDYIAETAASFRYGATVFCTVRLGDMSIGDDPVNKYLLVSNSHDGSANMVASIIPNRVWCANSLNVSHKGAKRSFKIRHTSSMSGRIAEANKALALSNSYFDAFSAEAEKMINETITLDKAQDIIEKAYPKPDNDVKGSVKKWESKVDTIWDIYNGDTCQNIFGTKWGIFNALEERLDWHRNSRTGNADNTLAAASGFDEVINKEKDRLFDLVMSF